MPPISREGVSQGHEDIYDHLKAIQLKAKSQLKVQADNKRGGLQTRKNTANIESLNETYQMAFGHILKLKDGENKDKAGSHADAGNTPKVIQGKAKSARQRKKEVAESYADRQIDGKDIKTAKSPGSKDDENQLKEDLHSLPSTSSIKTKTNIDFEEKNNEIDSNKTVDVEQIDNKNSNTNKKAVIDEGKSKNKKCGRSGRRFDRFVGTFHCRFCSRRWESSHVYTKPGTLKVLFKQRCQYHANGWVNPYKLEFMDCDLCKGGPNNCQCLCRHCGLLFHSRWVKDEDGKPIHIDKSVESCKCTGKHRKPEDFEERQAELKRSDKKHQHSNCEKCIKGLKCKPAWGTEDPELED